MPGIVLGTGDTAVATACAFLKQQSSGEREAVNFRISEEGIGWSWKSFLLRRHLHKALKEARE